jgi:cell division protease FtsH
MSDITPHPDLLTQNLGADDIAHDAWRDLARSALRRLKALPNVERFYLVEKQSPTADAQRISSFLEALAPDTSLGDLLHEDEVQAALAAGEDVERVALGRDPRIRAVHTRPAALQAVLRTCRTFPTPEHLSHTLCGRGTISVVETGDAALVSPLTDLLQAGEVLGLSGDELPYVTSAQNAVRDSKDYTPDLWGSFSPGLRAALERGRPIVVVAVSMAVLPAALRDLSPAFLRLAPLDGEVVLEHLRHSHSETRRISEALVRPHLPPDAMLGRLRMSDLALALRAESPAEVARQINACVAPQQSAGTPRLASFPMAPELRTAVDQLLADLRGWQAGEIPWRDVSRGLLLVGPPGTGKTEIPRLIAKDAGIAVVAGSLSRWSSEGSRSSDVIKAMRACFSRAAEHAPAILFIDEVDSFGDRMRAHDQNSSWTDYVVGALLECIDGFEGHPGVVVMGATNHVGKIDAALRRPGRFDKVLVLDHPDHDLMPSAFKWHLNGDLPDADLSEVTVAAEGMSGAEVAATVRAARALARKDRRSMTMDHLKDAVAAVRPPLAPDLHWRVAVHEAGHAIVSTATGLARPTSIAIVSTGGFATQTIQKCAGSREEFGAMLKISLAGRAAEVLVLGNHSMGAGGADGSDLAQATGIAAALEMSYGLGASAVWLGPPETAAARVRIDTALRIRVEAHLQRAEAEAMQILDINRELLEEMATALATHKFLSGVALDALVQKVV